MTGNTERKNTDYIHILDGFDLRRTNNIIIIIRKIEEYVGLPWAVVGGGGVGLEIRGSKKQAKKSLQM